jgi:excinuclease UvrABC nuclease subunit
VKIESVKISYTVNKNKFSNHFSKSDFVNHYNKNRAISYKSNLKEKSLIDTKISGCYFFYDKNYKIIYIGKSIACIKTRIVQHLVYEHNPYAIYNKSDIDFFYEKQKEVEFFSFCEIEKDYVDIVEIFLIKKYKPKYNSQYLYK